MFGEGGSVINSRAMMFDVDRGFDPTFWWLDRGVSPPQDVTDFIAKLKNDGGVPSALSGQAFADFMAAERARWGEVVKAANIKVE